MTSRFAIFVFSLFALAICSVEGVESQRENNTRTKEQIESVDGFQSNQSTNSTKYKESSNSQESANSSKIEHQNTTSEVGSNRSDLLGIGRLTNISFFGIGFNQEKSANVGGKPNQDGEKENKGGKEEPDELDDDDRGICYPYLGCFTLKEPWKSPYRPFYAPQSPDDIETTILFYSLLNPDKPRIITLYPQPRMKKARFNPRKSTAIIVHGFATSGHADWMKDMKNAYLKHSDANIMIVDWGKGAQLLSYLQVAGNTRVVGRTLGLFVRFLIKKYGADPGKFHLIGHGLGAHICSYLAKDVPGIGRITGLDPAQPGFEGLDKEVRLDSSDANFVDVIHTDARPFIPTLGFGMMRPVGHVDFYMNGGFDQPGCILLPLKELPEIHSILDLAKFPVEVIARMIYCPHTRAYKYLTEALNETEKCVFWGHKADVSNVIKSVLNTVTQALFKKLVALSTTCTEEDCLPLGYDTYQSHLRGSFVVITGGREPYCIPEAGILPV